MGAAIFVRQLTAILGEKADQVIHVREVRTVVKEATIAPHIDEPRPMQFLQVK